MSTTTTTYADADANTDADTDAGGHTPLLAKPYPAPDGDWASDEVAQKAFAHAAQLPRSILSQAADHATRTRLARSNPALAESYRRTLRQSAAYRAPSSHARALLLCLIVALFWYAFRFHSNSFPAAHPDEWDEAMLQDGDHNMQGFSPWSP